MNRSKHADHIVCHECDLLQRARAVPRGGSLRCARCDALLLRWAADNLDVPVALALAAAATFLIANIFPVMTLEFQASRMDATLLAAAWQLRAQDETLVGMLVFVTALLAPAALIGVLLWLLLPLRLGFRAPGFALLFRALMALSSWAMVEVLMLGVVVALVKLGDMATASAGIGMWAYAVTMLLLTLLSSSLQGSVIWAHYENGMHRREATPGLVGDVVETHS
ncbi:MAG: uncharacterized protein JWM03_725 [Rhodocyclales bacterium]|nr:uncharacterized protein [Rhodocyclales bacterium]